MDKNAGEKPRRPFVTICSGMSVDGKISNYKRECSAISSCDDREMLYDHRVEADAVMIGGNTLRLDDSGLTVKTDERRQKRIALCRTAEPMKIVAISDADDLNVSGDFFDKGEGKKIVFTTAKTSAGKIKELEGKATVHVMAGDRVDIEKALEILSAAGVKSLLVEGGGELISSLLEKDCVDEIDLKIGNLILGGRNTATLVDGDGFDALSAKKVEFIKVEQHPNFLILKMRMVKQASV
ncbi:MAG: dihydrofolate reductase family protein [Parcubacteria group bacterium]